MGGINAEYMGELNKQTCFRKHSSFVLSHIVVLLRPDLQQLNALELRLTSSRRSARTSTISS